MAKAVKLTAADEDTISKIYLIRDKQIMLNRDLAEFYEVTTGSLNKTVKPHPTGRLILEPTNKAHSTKPSAVLQLDFDVMAQKL